MMNDDDRSPWWPRQRLLTGNRKQVRFVSQVPYEEGIRSDFVLRRLLCAMGCGHYVRCMAADLAVVRVLIALLPFIPCVPSDQLREVVRLTPPNKLIEVYVGDSPLQWRTWSRQPGVSLIGDAAHAMLPTFGKPIEVIFRISSITTEKSHPVISNGRSMHRTCV